MSRDPTARRVFAVVPAAGRSRRMGRPKLLLPLDGRPVIEHVLSALSASQLAATVVVVRPDDEELEEVVRRCGAESVVPDTPPEEMTVSVQHGLRVLGRRYAPQDTDGWMLVLADQPTISPTVVRALVARWALESPASILVPVHQGRRGHPVLFGWCHAAEALAFGPEQGLNQLVHRRASDVIEVQVDDRGIVIDLDRPEDYDRLRNRSKHH